MPDNGEIVVTMYRQTDDRKVWYEWMVEVFALERVATSATKLASLGSRSKESVRSKENGPKEQDNEGTTPKYRRVRVGLSDLHSSIKDGCLM